MTTQRQLFLNHVAQTSPAPLGIEIVRAEGSLLFDPQEKQYVDLISGIAVSNVGHRHPKVVAAIQAQVEKYMHVMVYGEFIQSPQVQLAQKIASLLPPTLNCTYFTNSGAEAIEAAMKMAKRATGRHEIISFQNAYHGSTQGALSIMGSEFFKTSFRPLLPGTFQVPYNDIAALKNITEKTACVVAETVQGEAGAIAGTNEFLLALQSRCKEKGTLLIYDEIQTGFGRTGKMFGFEHSATMPDAIVFAKGLGGGLPIGALTASKELLSVFTSDPVLGHITTFGGNAVCCSAALATIEVIEEEKLADRANELEKIIRTELKSPKIRSLKGIGALFAVELSSNETVLAVIQQAVHERMISDWFVFNPNALRIAPPLNIPVELLSLSLKKLNMIIDQK